MQILWNKKWIDGLMQADTPARMNRQGAARTYHTYMNWGYFQRRMAQQRDSPSGSGHAAGESAQGGSQGGSSADSHVSYAGALLCEHLLHIHEVHSHLARE